MTRLVRFALAVGLLVVACNPTASGPLLPRPSPDPNTVTLVTAPPVTTTTAAVASEVVEAEPDCPTVFCLIYHIDPRASWSDGTPVTAADFAHTFTVHHDIAPGLQAPDYSRVTAVDVLDQKTARVVFDERYGAWQTLFSRVYRADRPVGPIAEMDSTGPFKFVEWEEGDQMTLERDLEWWAGSDPMSGEPLGGVMQVSFVFIDTVEEMVDALQEGEVDVITARPEATAVARLDETEAVEYTMAPGPFWEHIDFHHEDPMLSQNWVREVFSLAIDREEILDRTVRLLDPDALSLDNTIWMSGTGNYDSHFEDGHDPERAEQLLVDNGCTRGEDGIYMCAGTRMSFVWGSTNDDPARREIFESARESLAEIGIEIVPDFRSPSDFVTRDFLFGGPEEWQLVNFSWRARPDPTEANGTYYCDGELNVNRYCSEQVDQLIRATETIVEPERRAAVYNRADRAYLDDLALIPLYQKPTLMAWSDDMDGPVPNHTRSADLWNVASWSGKSSIVVALPTEPRDMNPLSWADDSANVILGSLLYGAFGMDPTQESLPVLIDSVDVVEGDG